MVRKQIYLEERQETRLRRLAHALGVSEAALIRQSLDRGLSAGMAQRPHADAWKEIEAFIRKRVAKGPLPGKRDWKREDLYGRWRPR